MLTRQEHCPCGTEQHYNDCCGRYIDKKTAAPTPEALMRSRYTAFTQANMDYLARTMVSPASDQFDPITAQHFAEQAEWIKLDVLSASSKDNIGHVEFVAHFVINGHPETIHEKSLFRHINGRWYYVDGDVES